jgi:hypothetical protein
MNSYKNMGRPKKALDKKQSSSIRVYLTDKERGRVERKAAKMGLSLSGFILECIREKI